MLQCKVPTTMKGMGWGSETRSEMGWDRGWDREQDRGKTGSEMGRDRGETGQNKIILGFRVPTKMLQCKVPTTMRGMGWESETGSETGGEKGGKTGSKTGGETGSEMAARQGARQVLVSPPKCYNVRSPRLWGAWGEGVRQGERGGVRQGARQGTRQGARQGARQRVRQGKTKLY